MRENQPMSCRRRVGLVLVGASVIVACTEDPKRPEAPEEERPMAEGGSGGGGRGGMTAAGGSGGVSQTGGTGGMSTASSSGGSGGATPDAAAGDRARPDETRDASGDVQITALPAFQVCSVCHGATGLGTDKAPEIQHPVRDYATWVARNGRTHPSFKEPMPKFTTAQVSMNDLNQIFDFLSAPPKPTTGPGLFKDFCANCHGADGKGGITMRDITLANTKIKTAAEYITNVRAGHHAGEFGNRREFMPKWTAMQLSDAEIRMIFSAVTGK